MWLRKTAELCFKVTGPLGLVPLSVFTLATCKDLESGSKFP